MEKERLDQMLVRKGLVASREKGRALIMAGQVFVNGRKAEKAGTAIDCADLIEIKGKSCPFVSRGGLKLEKALRVFNLDLTGKIVLDIGASTGGFTHCSLLHGAVRVYAVDVGYGQLDWSLRQDTRVINLERKNARYLTKEEIPEPVDVITIDASFISLKKILPVVQAFLQENGLVITLVKPQFEAGREKVGKKGVVKDAIVHLAVLIDVIDFSRGLGLETINIDYSPVTGPQGNIEFLLLLGNKADPQGNDWNKKAADIVKKAREELLLNRTERVVEEK